MQLLFCVIIFTKIGVIITKLIEVSNKLLKYFLFVIESVQESQKLLLSNWSRFKWSFSLTTDISEYFLHLGLVVFT